MLLNFNNFSQCIKREVTLIMLFHSGCFQADSCYSESPYGTYAHTQIHISWILSLFTARPGAPALVWLCCVWVCPSGALCLSDHLQTITAQSSQPYFSLSLPLAVARLSCVPTELSSHLLKSCSYDLFVTFCSCFQNKVFA